MADSDAPGWEAAVDDMSPEQIEQAISSEVDGLGRAGSRPQNCVGSGETSYPTRYTRAYRPGREDIPEIRADIQNAVQGLRTAPPPRKRLYTCDIRWGYYWLGVATRSPVPEG